MVGHVGHHCLFARNEQKEAKGNFLFAHPFLLPSYKWDVEICYIVFIHAENLLLGLCFKDNCHFSCLSLLSSPRSFSCLINFECVCVCHFPAAFVLLCFRVWWDLFSSLPVWFFPEPFGSSTSLSDSWMSLRTPHSEAGNAGMSLCLWDSGHVFGPTWQGQIENGGEVGEGGWMRGLFWHCRERVGILESSRGSASPEGGLSRRNGHPKGGRGCDWLPVKSDRGSSHFPLPRTQSECTWPWVTWPEMSQTDPVCGVLSAALKSSALACLCCDHIGNGGPALPLLSASGSGFVCLPVSIGVAAFQPMSLFFSS